jgi:Anti-sigma-K factor rskA
VTGSHDANQELLAGYVLRSLSGDDAVEADRILTEHVPTCPECRATLEAFQAVAGDLALDAPAAAPPDTLRARLQRDLEPRERSWRWNPGRIVAVAASVVLVVGVGGIAATQLRNGGGLVSGEGLARASLQDVTNAATSQDATTQALGPAKEIVAPATEKLYVYGSDIPLPPAGTVYRLWSGTADQATYIGDFLPSEDGTVLLEITLDAASVGTLLVTIEPEGSEPTQPGDAAWPAVA